MARNIYYGWPLVGVGALFYGLGIAPAYYSWGFFAPEIIGDVGITRQDIGEIFGAFTLMLAFSSVLAAAAIHRWGIRVTVPVGALIAATGWYLVGRADSLVDFYLSYALLGGIGVGLSTLVPAQTVSVYWFLKYRARAMAVIFLGAALVGAIVTPVDAIILEQSDWRTAWIYICATSVSVAFVTIVFLRNRPEDIGQRYDGAAEHELQASDQREQRFTLRQAITTPQFYIATLADVANAVPWRIITAHGRLHLENLGFAPTAAAAILGIRVGMSGVGRLSGSLSDFVRPTHVMALALMLSALGVGGLVFVESANAAYVCVVLMGIGYGAAFTTTPVVFGSFFGRSAFVGTAGLRVATTGVVGFMGASWAGAVADKTGSYTSALVALTLLCAIGAVMIFACKPPRIEDGS